MKDLKQSLIRLVRDEEGAATAEYSLLVALVAVIMVVTTKALGQHSQNSFDAVNAVTDSA
jgi:Flp pilus assembly pilin Flp